MTKKRIKGFWNDGLGVTVAEIAALAMLVLVGYQAIVYGKIDNILGDIAMAAILGVAGQHVGVRFARRGEEREAEIKNDCE